MWGYWAVLLPYRYCCHYALRVVQTRKPLYYPMPQTIIQGYTNRPCTITTFLESTISVSPRAQSKEGGRIEKTSTSKGLMHSNDHIKENWPTIEGGAPPYPPLGNHCQCYCPLTAPFNVKDIGYLRQWSRRFSFTYDIDCRHLTANARTLGSW